MRPTDPLFRPRRRTKRFKRGLQSVVTLWLWGLLALHPPVTLAQTAPPIVLADRVDWKTVDRDSDGQVSIDEYLRHCDDPAIGSRDFLLLDANDDHALTPNEFTHPFADPYQSLLDRAVEALDESYGGWQFRADETVDSTTFTINYAASLSTDGRRRLDRLLILHADPNRDRKVSRDEAIRFLEIQLGMRWTTGDRLRLDDGRVVRFAEFQRLDANEDDRIDQREFIDHQWTSTDGQKDFDRLDQDGNHELTLAEFATLDGPYVVSTIDAFRNGDTNMDARLDRDELLSCVETQRAYLIASNLRAFDEDADGKLTLDEYRLSMLACYNYPWENMPRDEDRDQVLSFAEFKCDGRNLFQLQRRFYFHELDADADGMLTSDEFEFRKQRTYSIVRISIDGERSVQLFRDPEYPVLSSPAVSPDQRWILFDATPPEGNQHSQIMRMTFEGEDAHEICDGQMPSWSPDGSQFACSRYEGGSSVWIMNMDGTPFRRIDDGWGAQWSPDGKAIAYTNDNSIRIYDVASGSIRTALPKNAHPYLYIYWNMCWSPDSRRIVFRGRLVDRDAIAITQVSGHPNLQERFSTKDEMGSDFAWSAADNRIFFNMMSRSHSRNLIFAIDPNSQQPPRIVPEADTSQEWKSVALTPDGQWMILVASQ